MSVGGQGQVPVRFQNETIDNALDGWIYTDVHENLDDAAAAHKRLLHLLHV